MPPPTITTRDGRVWGFSFADRDTSSVRHCSVLFSHLFLKRLTVEISENLRSSRALLTRQMPSGRVDPDQYLDNWARGLTIARLARRTDPRPYHARQRLIRRMTRSVVRPQPRERNDLDPQLANGRNVVVHIRISVKDGD